jgi:hypothetical protein
MKKEKHACTHMHTISHIETHIINSEQMQMQKQTYHTVFLTCSECGHLTLNTHFNISAVHGNIAGNHFPKILSVLLPDCSVGF